MYSLIEDCLRYHIIIVKIRNRRNVLKVSYETGKESGPIIGGLRYHA